VPATSRAAGPSAEDSVTRNAGFAFATKMVGAALTAALTIFLGRRLTASEYGAFAFALSLVLIAQLVADLGLTSSASAFLGARRRDLPAAAMVLRTTLGMKVVLAASTSAVLFAVAAPLCDVFGVPEATAATRVIAVSLFSESLFLLVLATFVSLARVRNNTIIAFWESVTETTASVVLVLLGAGAAGAAAGRAIGYTVGVLVGVVLLRRLLGPLGPGHPRLTPEIRRQVLNYSAALIVVDAAFRVFESIDVLLIAALLGSSESVGAFQLPMRLVMFLDYPAGAVSVAVAPRLSQGPDGPDLRTFTTALRLTTMLQMIFVAPLLVWPETVISVLFGDKYPEAPAVLRGLVPFVVFSGIAQLVTVSVNYLGEGRRRVPIAVLMLAVNVVIDLILLPRIGVVGGAIGTSVAYAIWVPSHVQILRRRAGLILRPVLVTSARTLLAAGAMCLVLLALGTGGDLAWWRIAAGAILGPAAYLATLAATGELRGEDVSLLRRRLTRS
jgi:stage V sporulation protein B